jgi:hypothetical protein
MEQKNLLEKGERKLDIDKHVKNRAKKLMRPEC